MAAAHKLDPFKGIIEARLQAYPKLTAQRLYEEVHAAGYGGGYSRVRDYVRQVRPQEVADPVVRFKTPPGRQGQVDFGGFKLPWGRRQALLVVLGYSRLLWLRFFQRQTMEVLCRGLERAFERRAIGRDLMRAQWRWPVGMPPCRPLGNGLWEIRTALPTKRTARVLLCFYRGHFVALHGFIKKTRATPEADLSKARQYQKELER